jgi:excisionase family DNA binding protein
VDDQWLTVKEAAERLKLSVPAIRNYIRLGKLPHYRHGRVVRLKRSDVDNLLRPGLRRRKHLVKKDDTEKLKQPRQVG